MSMRNKKNKEVKKVEIEKNDEKIERKDNLFNKTADLEKKVVSYNIPKVLADALNEYSFRENKSKSEFATKALLEYLPEKYRNKYIKID